MKSNGIIFKQELSTNLSPDDATTVDISRYQNNGVNTNVSYTQLPSGVWVAEFNDSSSKVLITQGEQYTSDYITMECWFKATAPSAANVELIDYEGWQAGGVKIEIARDASTITAIIDVDGTERSTSGQAITWGTIYYVVITYDGNYIRLYLDGVIAKTSSNYAGTIGTPTKNLNLGWDGASRWYNGWLARALLYNYALSAGAILNNYEKTKQLFRSGN